MLKQLILQSYDIDGVGYDPTTQVQIKPTAITDTIIGYANIARSKFTFKGINLKAIMKDEYDERDTFNIRLMSVHAIRENSANLITYSSNSNVRTSNIWMKGLNFINNKSEVLLGQSTNFNPDQERSLSLQFMKNDTNFRHYFNYDNLEGAQWYNFIKPLSANVLAGFRYSMSSTSTPNRIGALDGKIMVPTSVSDIIAGTPNQYYVNVTIEGGTPSTIAQTTEGATLTMLPKSNEWYFQNFNSDPKADSNYGIELTFYKPKHPIVDLEFELRDLLNDLLQPVSTTTRVYPALVFKFMIY